MTGSIAPSSECLLAEIFWGFPRLQGTGDLCTAPRIISLSPLSLETDATLGASDLWLGTRTGAGGTVTLTESFSGRSSWLHGKQVLSSMFSLLVKSDNYM